MQRMGGGKQKGGGNDPTCGCDLQAGWPSASALPRGGLQGGGNNTTKNIQEFNLRFRRKNGTEMHYEGTRVNNSNNNNNNTRKNNNTTNNNTNTTAIENEPEETISQTVTSAPSTTLKKIVHKGKPYFLSTTMNVYERSNAGNKGKMVGKLVRGSKGTTIKRARTATTNTNTNANMNTTISTPASEPNSKTYDLEEMPTTTARQPLSQEGGRRGRKTRKTRRKSRKHLRRK
jgi:hypothetical protein